jgi:hypothetical protein
MSDDVTAVDATEALEPPSTEVAYAWGSEPDEDFTAPADHVDEPATGAPVLAVAALAALALAISRCSGRDGPRNASADRSLRPPADARTGSTSAR